MTRDRLYSFMSKDLNKNKESPNVIAQRALDEAIERKKIEKNLKLPKEFDGRDGLEPTRYSDWEKNGITSDF